MSNGTTGGFILVPADDGVDDRDTDKIDYAAEFVRQCRMELRRINTALGAAENDFAGHLSPYQRRQLLAGIEEAFLAASVMFKDGAHILGGYLVEMDRKPSVK